MTIYGKFPILLPGLTESISRNGLKFTSGTIAFLQDDKDAAIELAESYGTLYPPPSARNTGDGFWELSFQSVTHTGERTKLKGSEIVTLSKSFVSPIAIYSINEEWMVDTITEFSTLDSEEMLLEIPTRVRSSSFSRRMITRQIIGNRPATAQASLNISWVPQIRSVTRRNFGDIDEADIVYALSPSVA